MSSEQPDREADREQETEKEARAERLPTLTMKEGTKLLDFSPDAIVVIDAVGTMILVNAQLATLFGYTKAELVSQPVELLLPTRVYAAHVAHRARYVAEPHQRPMGVGLDLVGRRKDGHEFPVDISLRPVRMSQTVHVVAAIRDITVQRFLEGERTLQTERLSQLMTLVNLAHDAIAVLDPLGRILLWSQGAEELYGWTAQEALGRVAHILLQTRFPTSRAAVDTALEHTGRWEGELVHITREGLAVTVDCCRVLLRDAFGQPATILSIARDITARHRQEAIQRAAHTEALAQRTFLQDLLDALPSSVCVVHGREARLVLANRETARVWGAMWPVGQPMQAFLKEHHIDVLDPQGRAIKPDVWAAMRALLDGDTVLQQQEVIRQPSGARLPILVNAVPLSSAHWQSLEQRDQAGRREPVRDAEPLALVIHQDVRLLKEAEYFKEEFIGMTAHELRQPLAALKVAVGTLVLQTARGHGTPLAAWQQEILQDLDQTTDRLTDLVDDLLDVSRLQAGRLALQRAPTNLIALAERVVKRFQQSTTRHQLTFSTTEAQLQATVDPRRIEQVLSNLLTNAIKYSPQGGPVTLQLLRDAARSVVELRVRDDGMGIPAHQQVYIFGRFMRADNALAAGLSGTGLGLYLCRALVEQHGGQLWFESTEGVGSIFFTTLPLEPAEIRGPLA
jgi:PAS domain S-box-containing protein